MTDGYLLPYTSMQTSPNQCFLANIFLYIKIECVSDCTGKDDGDYQSCTNCNTYVTCSNGITYADRPCPANLVWDDNLKRCEYESNTCAPKNKL